MYLGLTVIFYLNFLSLFIVVWCECVQFSSNRTNSSSVLVQAPHNVFWVSKALLRRFTFFSIWVEKFDFTAILGRYNVSKIAGPNSTVKWKIAYALPLNYRALIYFDIILEISNSDTIYNVLNSMWIVSHSFL